MISAHYTSKKCPTVEGTGTIRIIRQHTLSPAALLQYNIFVNDINHGSLCDGQVIEIEVLAGKFKLQVKEASYSYTRSKRLGQKTLHCTIGIGATLEFELVHYESRIPSFHLTDDKVNFDPMHILPLLAQESSSMDTLIECSSSLNQWKLLQNNVVKVPRSVDVCNSQAEQLVSIIRTPVIDAGLIMGFTLIGKTLLTIKYLFISVNILNKFIKNVSMLYGELEELSEECLSVTKTLGNLDQDKLKFSNLDPMLDLIYTIRRIELFVARFCDRPKTSQISLSGKFIKQIRQYRETLAKHVNRVQLTFIVAIASGVNEILKSSAPPDADALECTFKSKLKLTVVSANLGEAINPEKQYNLYCVVKYGELKLNSPIQEQTRSPTWNFTCRLAGNSPSITIKLCHQDPDIPYCCLGSAKINLSEVSDSVLDKSLQIVYDNGVSASVLVSVTRV